MTVYVAPIVEGYTEVLCIEPVLQRIWLQLLCAPDRLQVLPAARGPRSSLLKDGHPELNDRLDEAEAKLRRYLRHGVSAYGFILLLLDADDECPAMKGREVLTRAKAARGDVDVACVFARRALENWFVAAAESLAGVGGLPAGLTAVPDPEDIRAVTWLDKQLAQPGVKGEYKKPGDALAFVKGMSLAQCRDNSRSFRKLCKELAERVPAAPLPQPFPPPAPDAAP